MQLPGTPSPALQRPAVPLAAFIAVFAVLVALLTGLVFLPSPGPFTTTVTFRETGLPSAQEWSVTLANVTHSSSNDAILVRVVPGRYVFDVTLGGGSTSYVPRPAHGSLDVNVSGVSVPIVFIPATANVTVEESGLPDGTWWIVGEGHTHYSTNGTSLIISEPDGNHSLRVLVALNQTLHNVGPIWNDIDLYLPNVSRFDVAVSGSDLVVPVRFMHSLHMNYTGFPVHVFANSTGLGSPAFEYVALTFYRYTTVNYSFHGGPYGITPFPNVTAYLMTPTEFSSFAHTANATAYVLTSGNVSAGDWSLNFESGTWYFVLTGWSVDEYGAAGWSWNISFPGETTYYS